ncbi:MAG TPA: S41 family peptidase [Saprospirales bacterium]|nr:S41 family peptidase [Saprospirales bacterium]
MPKKHIKMNFKLTLVLPALLLSAGMYAQGNYFDIAKNMEIFANAYREVNHSYVDALDPSQVMRRGMDAMLEGLDPFTNYISETDIESYRIQVDGKYNGLGATGERVGDYVVLVEIIENSPAHKAGLKVGDALISIDGQSAKGRTEQEVQDFLRGYPGTKTELLVRRPGAAKDIKISLERGEVIIPNVPHSGLVADGIGYVNLTTFTENAGQNVADALTKLKQKNPGLKGMILDLRDNGGGLLNEAVNLVNVFVPKGELVASTRGKVPEWDLNLRTQHSPTDKDIPVVVLMNKMSASASEVTAGALQDLDRAVVMGQKSYGKGLVQNTKELGYNARIKLTTAKYYIPSGRCIQSVRYKDGQPVDIPEAERAPFKTRNGRTVLDGGGIKPDVVLPHDTAHGAWKALLDQNIVFDYVTQYVQKHEKIDSIEVFEFKDFDDFAAFVQTKNFDYQTHSEQKLTELRKIAEQENWPLDAEIKALEAKIKQEKKGEMLRQKEQILHEIEQEIVGRYYFHRGKVRKNLVNDPEIKEAVKLLNDPTRYQSILKGM